jgi:ribosomal protein S18 acetylase RimI-like enzyme
MDLPNISNPNFQLNEIVIRQLVESDLPLLEWDGEYSHYRRLYLDAYNQTFEDRVVMWVAISTTNEMIGQLFVQLNSIQIDLADGYYRAYMLGFRVKPEYRNRGIGTLLLLQVESDLLARKFQRVCLNVIKTNWRARNLYERHGYHVLFDDPGEWSYQDNLGIWHDVKEAAWRMEKSLVNIPPSQPAK